MRTINKLINRDIKLRTLTGFFATEESSKAVSSIFKILYDLENLDKIDEKKDEKELIKWKKDKVFSFVGYDAIEKMVDFIMKAHVLYRRKDNNIFSLVSFNGSNFDNFFLLDYILKFLKRLKQ